MVIEYQIRRIDVVKAYFYNLRHSSRTQLIIFGFAIFVVLQHLVFGRSSSTGLSISDYATALIYGIVAVLLIPAIGFVLAKTQRRILSINQQGIETRIGAKEGKIPWTTVENVTEVNDRIIITGKNANVFTIPINAFSTKEQRTEFLNLTKRYQSNSKISNEFPS